MNICKLKEKEKKLIERLKEKRLQLGEADGAMQSRFPSGRFELENEIKLLEMRLHDLKGEIKKLTLSRGR